MQDFSPRRCATAAALLAALGCGAAAAQPPAQTIAIEMSNFRYSPAMIRLEHGHKYRLHFVNRSGGGHDFTAGAFFGAAEIDPADRAKINRGGVSLRGHEEKSISLTAPAAGRYKVRCSHFMHSTFGMNGEIVVL
jgi:plastocyanin